MPLPTLCHDLVAPFEIPSHVYPIDANLSDVLLYSVRLFAHYMPFKKSQARKILINLAYFISKLAKEVVVVYLRHCIHNIYL